MKKTLILSLIISVMLLGGCSGGAAGNTKVDNLTSNANSVSSSVSVSSAAEASEDAASAESSAAVSESQSGDDTVSASDSESVSDSEADKAKSSGASSDTSSAEDADSDITDEEDETAAAEEAAAILPDDLDEGLCIVLAEIAQTIHPGEAGMSLKSTQAAADVLDFALGTDLSADEIEAQTKAFISELDDDMAAGFPDKVLFMSESMATLQTDYGQTMLTDAGVTDSSFPWTDDAFERARAIVRACGL